MGIALFILAGIAIGALAISVVTLSVGWIIRRFREHTRQKRIKKMILTDVRALSRHCDNRYTLEQLNQLAARGGTHLITEIGEDGNICDTEAVHDNSAVLDAEVAALLGREGMVVLEDS